MKLLPIYPRGLGTGGVESLGSYVLRCGIAHRLGSSKLTAALLSPSGISHLNSPASRCNSECAARPLPNRSTLASPNNLAVRIARALDAVYETNAFSSLGLLKLYPHFLGFKGIFRMGFQWCPVCWEQDVDSGQAPYFRYVWSFKGYEACEKHQCSLIDACPSCGKEITHALKNVLTECSKCGAELVGEAITRRRNAGVVYYRDLVEVVEYIQQNPEWRLSGGSVRRLCPKYLLSEVMEYGQRWTAEQLLDTYQKKPTFTMLRRVSWFFRIDLWRLISGRDKQLPLLKLDGECERFPPGIDSRTKTSPPGNDEIMRGLRKLMYANADSPRPAKFYAQSLGMSSDGFHYRYPDLYKRIVEYFEYHRHAERVRLRMLVDTVLELMKSEGSLDRGVKKVCRELMEDWGFPKNVTREKIKEFRDAM